MKNKHNDYIDLKSHMIENGNNDIKMGVLAHINITSLPIHNVHRAAM